MKRSWITKKGRQRHPAKKELPSKAPSFTGYGMRINKDGSVSVPRTVETKQGREWSKAKTEDLSTAVRMQKHIYESELEEGHKVLHSIRTTIDTVNEILRLKSAMTEEQKNTIRKIIADLYAEYGNPNLKNHEKVRAGQMFGKALDLFRKGNWSAAVPAMNSAVESLIFRHEDTLGIRERTRRKGTRIRERMISDRERDNAVMESIERISAGISRNTTVTELWDISRELTSTANRLSKALGSGRKQAQKIIGAQIRRANEARDLRLNPKEKRLVEASREWAGRISERTKNTEIDSLAREITGFLNKEYAGTKTLEGIETTKELAGILRDLNKIKGLRSEERWTAVREARARIGAVKWITPTLKAKEAIVAGIGKELERALAEIKDPYGKRKQKK